MKKTHKIISKKLGRLFFILAFGVLIFTPAHAQPLSSAELIKNSRLYDGKTVVFAGEVIGDVMLRGDYAWVNLNDGAGAIGVWVERSLASQIHNNGSYKSRGDWVEVVGLFNRSCLQHGGDLDIHAQSLRKLSTGGLVIERFNLGKRNLIIALAALLSLLWILSSLKKKQNQK
ncbi:MAG: DNA-binding protein [Candidatus Omnitrophica bacterium]|nr:DNA-binding protein [Candidatus Omnitrophota bacterium]